MHDLYSNLCVMYETFSYSLNFWNRQCWWEFIIYVEEIMDFLSGRKCVVSILLGLFKGRTLLDGTGHPGEGRGQMKTRTFTHCGS